MAVGTVSLKSETASRSVRMVRTALGPTITRWLEDPAIVEVMLNPHGRLWIDRLTGSLLIGNFNGLAKIVFNSFSGLGLKAAGSGLSADQFLQPGRIAQVGIDAGWPILQAVSSLVGFTAIINPEIWLQLAVLLVALVVVVGSFFVLAIQLFVTLIEFKLTTLAGFVLVPFGLLGQTAFLAERILGNAVASGVKILVLQPVPGLDAVAPEQRLAQESEAARLSRLFATTGTRERRRRLRRPLLLRTRAFTKRINRSQSKRHMHD
jgi:TrbL/VirB6 plasmid conjugal transfer protein